MGPTGKPMKGFVFVGAEGPKTDRMLERWVARCVLFATSLAPKKPRFDDSPQA